MNGNQLSESSLENYKADPRNFPQMEKEKKEVSELGQVYDRISKLNVEYQGILYEVEEKLHSIKNMRSPDNKLIQEVDREGGGNNDFISAINQHLEIFSQYNSRLQKVLKHCSSII